MNVDIIHNTCTYYHQMHTLCPSVAHGKTYCTGGGRLLAASFLTMGPGTGGGHKLPKRSVKICYGIVRSDDLTVMKSCSIELPRIILCDTFTLGLFCLNFL